MDKYQLEIKEVKDAYDYSLAQCELENLTPLTEDELQSVQAQVYGRYLASGGKSQFSFMNVFIDNAGIANPEHEFIFTCEDAKELADHVRWLRNRGK